MDPQQAVPIVLNGPGLRVLIVGGGAVGARRATSLVEAGATVRVVTIQQRATLPAEASVELRPFEPNDVDGANLVVAATDDPAANASVGDAAKQRNVLCCRADVSELGEVLFARKVTAGPMVAGVVSGSPTMSGRAVEAVRQTLEPLAEFARAQSSIRSLVKASPGDAAQKQAVMRDAASAEAEAAWESDGVDGLRLWLAGRHEWLRSALIETW